jgi:hypothetical protein
VATAGLRRRSEALAHLHQSYRQGQLRVLVGAGSSVASGFPRWDQLNLNLLIEFLRVETSENKFVTADGRRQLAQRLYDALGRDAAADFVKLATGDHYFAHLAHALYEGRAIADLPIRSVHRHLAAIADRADLYTTNFDPLIELAIDRLRGRGGEWQRYRRACEPGFKVDGKRPLVHHVHGWLDEDGAPGGTVILTDAQYFALQQDPRLGANLALTGILEAKGAVLIIGMSFTDSNLRRLIYWRSQQQKPANKVYAVLKATDPALLDYTEKHWASRRVELFPIEDYEEIPELLRDVRWGPPEAGSTPTWCEPSIKWIRKHLPEHLLFSDEWQQASYLAMRALKKQFYKQFGLPFEERINIALFVPRRERGEDVVYLSKVATTTLQQTGAGARDVARSRRFALYAGREEGVAGRAFVSGRSFAAAEGDGLLNANFPRRRTPWDAEDAQRDWRSLMTIPLLDTEQWIPLAVIVVTSNLLRPFWARFGERQDDYLAELETCARNTARLLLSPKDLSV